jgi:hypothetical protein
MVPNACSPVKGRAEGLLEPRPGRNLHETLSYILPDRPDVRTRSPRPLRRLTVSEGGLELQPAMC